MKNSAAAAAFGDSPHCRRSANYKPNIWKYDFLQSLRNKHTWDEGGNSKRVTVLVDDVKKMLVDATSLKAKLELIDTVKKTGLASLFDKEIEEALGIVVSKMEEEKKMVEKEDLYTTALLFRLLRQHGHDVSQDVFMSFEDEAGGFLEAKFGDTKGAIGLLEASHFAREGEVTLERAKIFSIGQASNDCDWPEVRHVLELPLHWRVEWFDARWQIRACEKGEVNGREDVKYYSSLVELAKLHFNTVQATHQEDLKELSRWWKDLRLLEHLNFTRDRLVESFLCAVGLAHEPHYSAFRKCLTKVIIFILVIDDVYDLYGSLEELQCFTTAIDRWSFTEIENLPECMKQCFQALHDVTNEIAYEIRAAEGLDQVLQHLRKTWADFCKSLLAEATWFSSGYTPTLDEYLDNAWISSSGPLILSHAAFFVDQGRDDETSELLETNKDLICNSSLIIRLCNDLATSESEKERGDAPSAILCYKREKNVSEEEASEHVNGLIAQAWKSINGISIGMQHSQSVRSLIRISSNAARVAHMLYQHGDGFGIQDGDIRRQILASLIQPFT